MGDESRLIEKEEMERGAVSYRVYLYYLRALGWPAIPLIALYLLQPVFSVSTNFWLSAWSEAGVPGNDDVSSIYGFISQLLYPFNLTLCSDIRDYVTSQI